MPVCPACTAPNPAPARFCLNCGQSLVAGYVCSTCYTLLPPNARYCFHCGTPIIVAGSLTAVPQMVVMPQAQPQPVTVPAVPVAAPTAPVTLVAAPAASTAVSVSVRPIADMLASLRHYLPDRLYEPLERSPNPRDLDLVYDHLVALLRAAKTYLPRPVILEPQPPGEPAGGMCQGTFIFVDSSGFTALSERLARASGQAGAVRVTEIMNSLFLELVGRLYDYGGSLLKFGGDAILGVFEAESEGELHAGALQAVRAALAMQGVMGKFSAIEAGGQTSALKIKVGICTGTYFAAHIGTPQKMGYVTTGRTVNNTEHCEEQCEGGEIILAQSTLNLVQDLADVETRAEGFYLLKGCKSKDENATGKTLVIPADDNPPGDVSAQITYLVQRLDRLTPYLAADLLPRMVTNPEDIKITPEHRPVTVMFVNYVGISDLIEDMGASHPELITKQLHNYFVHMAAIVEKYEGTLARMDHYAVGDRLVIFFGAPRAHEDDPVRAVYTALDMQAATRKRFAALQTPDGVYRFRQRVGINTGKLFAGNVGAANLRQEYTLMGDDINMAARLMSKSGWEEIFISKVSWERVNAYFETESKGELKVKGKEILIPTYKVLGRRQEIGQTRGVGAGPVPMLGRDKELESALQCGETLLNGRGQILAIIGDSGQGKSRLTREFKQALQARAPDRPLRWLEAQALSFSEQVSYWLAAQMLYGALGLSLDANPDDVLFNLWEKGEELLGKEKAREAVPYLAYLLDLTLEGDWADRVTKLEPKARQKQTFWAMREFFAALAKQQPILIVLDDLHWADEASLALFEDLLGVTDRAALMFCLVFREVRDKGAWRLRDRAAGNFAHRYTQVQLAPLSPPQSEDLLQRLLPGAELLSITRQQILDKTAGNPFYLEEVVRALKDSGAVVQDSSRPGKWRTTDKVASITVPDTLQGAIVARIDRLTEDARVALQMAAVIGRRFQKEVLLSLTGAQSEVELLLAQLERSGMIRTGDSTNDAIYNFPDALVQEMAYDGLLLQRREEFHRQVGETLENVFADRREQECETLAYHFSRSNDKEKARHYLELAGRRAQAEFANETAMRHYTDLLARLGDDAAQWVKRFDVLNRRQQIYGLLGKQPERDADLRAMLTLVEAHADENRRGDVLNGLADMYQWTGRYDEAIQTANEALAIEEKYDDKAGQASALHQLGVVYYYRGNYAQAEPALQKAASLRHALDDAAGEAWSQLYLTMINFVSGNYGQAWVYNERALQAAASRQDWLQMGIHLNNGGRIAHRLGEYETALTMFNQSLEMRARVGDRTGQGFTLFGIGLVHVYMNQYAEAEAALQKSQEIRKAIADERGLSYGLYTLGLIALGRGALDQAASYFKQAQEMHQKLNLKGELIADLSWLGQVYLQQSRIPEAQTFSSQAVEQLAGQKNVEEVQQIYLNHYRILKAQNDPAAGEFLQKARQAVQAQAEAIADAEKRASFLSKVKVNQAIAAAEKEA